MDAQAIHPLVIETMSTENTVTIDADATNAAPAPSKGNAPKVSGKKMEVAEILATSLSPMNLNAFVTLSERLRTAKGTLVAFHNAHPDLWEVKRGTRGAQGWSLSAKWDADACKAFKKIGTREAGMLKLAQEANALLVSAFNTFLLADAKQDIVKHELLS
jgi:hypothetical protein